MCHGYSTCRIQASLSSLCNRDKNDFEVQLSAHSGMLLARLEACFFQGVTKQSECVSLICALSEGQEFERQTYVTRFEMNRKNRKYVLRVEFKVQVNCMTAF